MKRKFLSGYCSVVLSLMVSWVAQAQTTVSESGAVRTPAHVRPATTSIEPATEAVTPGPNHVAEAIASQRQVLAAQRSAILQAEATQIAECWQKFAVNICLSEVRRARRQALEPLRQQELALNAQERLWRAEERERRLQNKQADARKTP